MPAPSTTLSAQRDDERVLNHFRYRQLLFAQYKGTLPPECESAVFLGPCAFALQENAPSIWLRLYLTKLALVVVTMHANNDDRQQQSRGPISHSHGQSLPYGRT